MKWNEKGLKRIGEWKERIGNIKMVGIGGLSVESEKGVLDDGEDIV